MSTTRESPQIDDVGQIAIFVRDLPRAVRFYRETLEIPFLFEIPSAAFFQCGSVRLMLGPPETPELEGAASILYFRVRDLQAAHESLVARGVRFDREPHLIARMPDHELWMAFFRDSEENLMALMSEVR